MTGSKPVLEVTDHRVIKNKNHVSSDPQGRNAVTAKDLARIKRKGGRIVEAYGIKTSEPRKRTKGVDKNSPETFKEYPKSLATKELGYKDLEYIRIQRNDKGELKYKVEIRSTAIPGLIVNTKTGKEVTRYMIGIYLGTYDTYEDAYNVRNRCITEELLDQYYPEYFKNVTYSLEGRQNMTKQYATRRQSARQITERLSTRITTKELLDLIFPDRVDLVRFDYENQMWLVSAEDPLDITKTIYLGSSYIYEVAVWVYETFVKTGRNLFETRNRYTLQTIEEAYKPKHREAMKQVAELGVLQPEQLMLDLDAIQLEAWQVVGFKTLNNTNAEHYESNVPDGVLKTTQGNTIKDLKEAKKLKEEKVETPVLQLEGLDKDGNGIFKLVVGHYLVVMNHSPIATYKTYEQAQQVLDHEGGTL